MPRVPRAAADLPGAVSLLLLRPWERYKPVSGSRALPKVRHTGQQHLGSHQAGAQRERWGRLVYTSGGSGPLNIASIYNLTCSWDIY